MAKKSKVAKHERQQALVEQYAELRRTLKAEGRYDELRKILPRPGYTIVVN
ncbi:hypothetical protein OLL48_002229 [Listeria monocytogenes]|nr:hypothetical protein [Listeria monocytogenes]